MGLAPATGISETLHLATLAPYRVSLATKNAVDNHIGDIKSYQSHVDFQKGIIEILFPLSCVFYTTPRC